MGFLSVIAIFVVSHGSGSPPEPFLGFPAWVVPRFFEASFRFWLYRVVHRVSLSCHGVSFGFRSSFGFESLFFPEFFTGYSWVRLFSFPSPPHQCFDLLAVLDVPRFSHCVFSWLTWVSSWVPLWLSWASHGISTTILRFSLGSRRSRSSVRILPAGIFSSMTTL